jgi:hypothetical protein
MKFDVKIYFKILKKKKSCRDIFLGGLCTACLTGVYGVNLRILLRCPSFKIKIQKGRIPPRNYQDKFNLHLHKQKKSIYLLWNGIHFVWPSSG